MEFEWDPDRASASIKKHGVEFAEAITVFGDPLEITIVDPDHSDSEFRSICLGVSASGRRLKNESNMNPQESNDEMRSEYDFSGGVRGKHYEAYRAGTNVNS